MDLTDAQIDRYARHLVLPEIGEEGQAKLLASRVLVVGAGGLGSPLLLYLAAAGIGRLGVIDDDAVEISNLQRQILHDSDAIGRNKAENARLRLAAVNPEVKVSAHAKRLNRDNVAALVADYDLVADGSDNFATRYLLNDACYFAGRPLVSAAIMRFDGQLTTYKAFVRPRKQASEAHPCHRCIFGPEPPDPKESCADVGVLNALPGTLGALQATEVVKELLGIGRSLSGQLVLYDALEATFRRIAVKADPACPLCGPQATVSSLADQEYGEGPLCRVSS
ncbi:MAG: HesA/MoeB/ThiF family protein [Kiloniellales bacterium]